METAHNSIGLGTCGCLLFGGNPRPPHSAPSPAAGV